MTLGLRLKSPALALARPIVRRVAGGLSAITVVGLLAVPALTQAQTQHQVAACGPRSIGLSRTVQIDTAAGPRFGHQQYKELDFLADGEVVLTFDDGPSSIHTPRVLKALEEHCTKATFFMVGSRALAEHRIVKDIARRGHTIGTHTWSHANMRAIGAVRAKDEIEMGISAVQRAAGQPIAPFFRFPYLADSRAMQEHLKARDVGMFSIDADAYDYKTLNPAEVHKAIISQITAKRKGIILFHDIQPATAGALSGLLADLKARGFKVVHMAAKTSGTTLPAYDVMANRDAGRRMAAVAASPLAKRAVTWPMPTVQPTTAGGSQAPLPWANAPPQQPQPLATPAAVPPPQVAGFPPISAPMPAPRRTTDEVDWRKKIFNN